MRELSPRFDDAANFVRRNFDLRRADFTDRLGSRGASEIIQELEARNEEIYACVDSVYFQANGAHIPVEGRESAQDLIATFCDKYCGPNGHFARLVIIFDEFGRFLEYVAERPALAGDAALQQIFQGIQDAGDRAHFIGFIQYELKAYLARLGQRDAMYIQKYISRFDVAKKYYVSSNLETIIAHLLEKRSEKALDQLLGRHESQCRLTHALMAEMLPGFKQLPVWKDFAEFERVIGIGCWPLHPLATWFLTRQQDILQSRSAITFVRSAIETVSEREASCDERAFTVSASRLLSGELLTEMLAAERAHGGGTVDNLFDVLNQYDAQLDEPDRNVLVAVSAAKKMRVVSPRRDRYDDLLSAFSGLGDNDYRRALAKLENELGIVIWSDELKQYEVISDAATRSQYQREIQKRVLAVTTDEIRDVFVGRCKAWADGAMQDIPTAFGQERSIPTLEWSFVSHIASAKNVASTIQRAFDDWREAIRPDQAKGQAVFTYLDEASPADIEDHIQRCIDQELTKSACSKAPIWIIPLADPGNRIKQYLTILYILEERFDPKDTERFARFIPEERASALQALHTAIKTSIQARKAIFAGVSIASSRLARDGSAIFEQVYPEAVAFPFDGFASKSGNGSIDAATLARALFGREVSAPWLDVQIVRLQNRVSALLGIAWGVLDSQGRISGIPSNAQVRSLIDEIERLHRQHPERDLAADLQTLLRPPYGCNLASAALLLGLVVGKAIPPRVVQYDGQSCALQDWLRLAFGSNGRFLDASTLGKTALAIQRFFSHVDQLDANPDTISHRVLAHAQSNGVPASSDTPDSDADIEDDSEWMKKCVNTYAAVALEQATSRSSQWLSQNLENLADLARDPQRLLPEDSTRRFEAVPIWVSEADRGTLEERLAEVQGLRCRLVKDSQRRQAQAWIAQINEDIKDISIASAGQCKRILERIDNAVIVFEAAEQEFLNSLRAALKRRLDELDVSDLLVRIEAMPEHMRRTLFRKLANFYAEEMVR